jgi:hypothetical protein
MCADVVSTTATPAGGPMLLKSRDAARTLAIRQRSLWELRRRGHIRAVKLGGCLRYPIDELNRVIEQNREQK